MIQETPPWATHYRFYDFPHFNQYFIPKEGLQTWFDLKYELDDHVHIDYNHINIVVNKCTVFYADQTLLEDVDLKQTDQCIVVVKRNYDQEKEKKEKSEYERYVENSLAKGKDKIDKKLNDPYFKSAMENVNSSNRKKILYNQLVREFSKWECLVAFQKSPLEEIRDYLARGKAKQQLQLKESDDERAQIDEFFKKEGIQEIKREIFEKSKSTGVYEVVMRKIFDKYPQFMKLEVKHKEYVKKHFEQKPAPSIQKQVIAILSEVERKRAPVFLTETERNAFRNPYILSGIRGTDIDSVIRLAGSNLTLAAEYLRSGPADTSQNVTMCLKKSSKTNLVLQFFNHPIFSKIFPKLKQNRAKCEAFLDSIIAKYKQSHPLLITLVKKYKLYVVTVLTGIYVVDKEKDLESKQIIFSEQLSLHEQAAQREKILKAVNSPLVLELTKYKIEERLAASAVRAAANDSRKIEPYLSLGGINKRFDFCNPTKENEQIYLQRYFKKEVELLTKLRDKEAYTLWLGSTSQTSPLLFEIIIRNKPFLDKLIAGGSVIKKQ